MKIKSLFWFRSLLVLPIAEGVNAHWAKTIKLLRDDLVRTVALERHGWRRVHALLSGLCLLRRVRLLRSVHVRLFPNVDFVVRRSRVHVIRFSMVLDRGNRALRQLAYGLLLFGCCNSNCLKTRLCEQSFVLGSRGLTGSLASSEQCHHCYRTRNTC